MSEVNPLFQLCGGDLFRKSDNKKVRSHYAWQFRAPKCAWQVAACLRSGPYAWPGGYPIFFVADDGAALCFACVRKEFRRIASSHISKCNDGWRVIGCDVNWEDDACFCSHCNKQIESAYGGDK